MFKQKTAYEMRISDWSSDVCSTDLVMHQQHVADRLRHLLGLDIDEAVMHPVAAEQPAAMGAGALGDLVFVVRKDQVVAAAMDVDGGGAEILLDHRRAFDMPARDRKSTRLNSSH